MRLFSSHITHLLSAYDHGELSAREATRVAAHLETCPLCRTEYESLRKGHLAMQQLPVHSAPDSLWSRIEAELPGSARVLSGKSSERQPANGKTDPALPGGETGSRRGETLLRGSVSGRWKDRLFFFPLTRLQRSLALAGALAVCGIATVITLRSHRPPVVKPVPEGPFWEVSKLIGAPTIGSQKIAQTGRLRIGDKLVTDGVSKAEITVANTEMNAKVRVEPNTTVSLLNVSRLKTGEEHRLGLTQGEIFARVKAPPRLFVVDTDAAQAVDLGCEYSLRVEAGITYLHVTSGKVVLEWHGRSAYVPAGAKCETHPGIGPGTPYSTDAPEPLIAALKKYDFESGGEKQLQIVLDSARPLDTLPLWHLLMRVQDKDRGKVFDRLARLSPPPRGVTRAGILQKNQDMLDLWKKRLEPSWAIPILEGGGSLLYGNP